MLKEKNLIDLTTFQTKKVYISTLLKGLDFLNNPDVIKLEKIEIKNVHKFRAETLRAEWFTMET
jgi:hypothetical protein